MDAPQTFKFGEKLLPRDLDPKWRLMDLETPDGEVNLLELDPESRSEVLRNWSSQGNPFINAQQAHTMLGRHRWSKDNDNWTQSYDVADMERIDRYLGRPKVRQLRNAVQQVAVELDKVIDARKQPHLIDDPGLLMHQQQLELALASLLNEKQAADMASLERLRSLQENNGNLPPFSEEEDQSTRTIPGKSQDTKHAQSSLAGALPLAQMTMGLACAFGLSYFSRGLAHRKKRAMWQHVLGFGLVVLSSAVYVLQPFKGKRNQPKVKLPSSPGDLANLLLMESDD